MEEHKTTADKLFASVIFSQTVKSKTKSEKIEIIKDVDFFKTLKALGLVKTEQPKKNLCKFLCIDENYLSQLMFKKLTKALKDFSESLSLTLIGC